MWDVMNFFNFHVRNFNGESKLTGGRSSHRQWTPIWLRCGRGASDTTRKNRGDRFTAQNGHKTTPRGPFRKGYPRKTINMLVADKADEEISEGVDVDRESRIQKERRRREEQLGSSREISEETGVKNKPSSVTATDGEQGLHEILVNMKRQME